jgi:hypothetical protein
MYVVVVVRQSSINYEKILSNERSKPAGENPPKHKEFNVKIISNNLLNQIRMEFLFYR